MAVLTQIRTRKSRNRAKVAFMRGRSKKDCLDLSLELPGLGAPDREILPVWAPDREISRSGAPDREICQLCDFSSYLRAQSWNLPVWSARPGDLSIVRFQLLSKSSELESPGLGRQTGRSPGLGRVSTGVGDRPGRP